MNVLEEILTRRQLIVWELRKIGGPKWIAYKLGTTEERVHEIIKQAEDRIRGEFTVLERIDDWKADVSHRKP